MQWPVQQSPSWLQLLAASRQAQRPAMHSMAPQHSVLARQPPRAAVQQRCVPRRTAQVSVPQHWAPDAHTVVLAVPRQVALGGRQRLPEQVKPGQQSVLEPQLSSRVRQAQ